MPDGKKVLFVVNHADFFLSHRLPLALAANMRGYEVHLASMRTDAIKQLRHYPIIWHEIPLVVRVNPWRDAILFRSLVGLYKSIRPTIIHHVTIKPVLYGSVASRLARVPAVVNALSGLGYLFISEENRNKTIRKFITPMMRWGLGHPNSVLILQNDDDADDFVEANLVAADKIRIIRGSGVNMKEFPVTPVPRTKVVSLISRMLWDKGIGEFVEAAKLVRSKDQEIEFRLIGEPDANNPQAIPTDTLKQWENDGHVRWLGHQDNVESQIRESTIVCLPSYREGLPKVLIEAAASGRPLVATDVPGCRDIARHGENALLCPVKESKCLAQAIETLLSNYGLAQQLGAAGAKLARENFSLEKVVAETMQLYTRICTG